MSARILLVDDVPANARLLTAKLEAAYYQVDTAVDGFAAIAAASRGVHDLILLDVMMPGLDGFETCRHLKAEPATRHIPVMMVTALGQPEERVRGLEAGADDFLTKPVEFDTLLARVRGLVRLKRLFDEWRLRARTVQDLGLSDGVLAAPSLAGRHALVIDDWEPWSRAAQDALALDGLVPDPARGEQAAFDRLDGRSYDLIVLSLSLAAEDSLRLASRLHVDPRTADVPLVVVAEADQRDRLFAALDMGASDWLARPVDANELRARARNQIRRKQYQDQLRAELSEALQLALMDPMTGLHNRRYLMRHLASLLATGTGPDVAVLMIDVDHFKSINDRWGHRAGDRVLGHVAATLQGQVRSFDTLARYGGEEFVVVMPGTGLDEAMAAAERLRRAVEQAEFAPDGTDTANLTVSIGLSCLAGRTISAEQLLHSADLALYDAKRGGRNRTVAATEIA